MKNSILDIENDVAERIAQRTLAKRETGYASEVRRLLDAALEVMRKGGTAARPRAADIVAAAHAVVGKIYDYLWQRTTPPQNLAPPPTPEPPATTPHPRTSIST